MPMAPGYATGQQRRRKWQSFSRQSLNQIKNRSNHQSSERTRLQAKTEAKEKKRLANDTANESDDNGYGKKNGRFGIKRKISEYESVIYK